MRALAVLAAALILAGCDPAVQARRPPTSVDEAFGPFVWRREARQVYELPAERPALDPLDARPRDCRPPGPQFKPQPLVGIYEPRRVERRREPLALVGWQEPAPSGPPPLPPLRLHGWYDEPSPGAKEPIATRLDPLRLEPGRSVYRAEPIPLAAYRRDEVIWCNEAARRR